MTTPKLFIFGATGYIGGDFLYAIEKAHPEWELTCIVRTTTKGASIAKAYPKVRLVYGDLGSVDLIEAESKRADIVLNFADADNEAAARAIVTGIASKSTPGFYIHTSGTAIIAYPDIDADVFGEASSKIWDDVSGIAEIRSIPDHAPHRNVDKIVFAAGTDHPTQVKTAIVCPPCIYGPGRGPDNQRSIQLPGLVKASLERKETFQVNAGKAMWSNVHVHDLSDVYVLLSEQAASGGGVASWGADGYYFTGAHEHVWADASRIFAESMHKLGYLPTAEVASLSNEEIRKIDPWGTITWGSNSRSRSSRARKLLGWNPTRPEFTSEELVKGLIDAEATKLGLKVGHAAKVESM